MATKRDLADFRQFCRDATTAQLRAIVQKERDAGRRAYMKVAAKVLAEREGGPHG